MSTPLRCRVRRTWDAFNSRETCLLAHDDKRLDGTPLAFGLVGIPDKIRRSMAELNSRRAALGLSPIPV